VFDFLTRKTETPSVDEHATNLGADSQTSQSNIGVVASHQVSEAREAALKLSAESSQRRKPGRPRKDQSDGGTNRGTVQAKVDAEIIAQLEQVHDPKAWGALLAAPADVALTMTGRDYWKTSDRERDTLGACGSTAARTLMITNPKSLALLMLAAGMFSVYMPRLTKELAHQREEAEKAKARKMGVKVDEQK